MWWKDAGIPPDWEPGAGTVIGDFTIDAKLMMRIADQVFEIKRWPDAFLVKGTGIPLLTNIGGRP